MQVSARRQGKVTAYDAGARQISMEPWPRPGIHPVWAERAQAAGVDYYEYTESIEEGGEGGHSFFCMYADELQHIGMST